MTIRCNSAILKLSKRAETYDRAHLVSTFVDVGPFFTLLSNIEHQILYGRRGTGKTHALSYLSSVVDNNGDISIFIDMRTIGSSGGIYSDPSIPLSERATRLLVDTLAIIHDRLLSIVIEREQEFNLAVIGPILDRFADAITEVKVVGTIQTEDTVQERVQDENGLKVSMTVDTAPRATMEYNSSSLQEQSVLTKSIRSGTEKHRVHFGTVRNALAELMRKVTPRRVWILLDEWSEIPLDIQPYLSDLLRRTVFTIQGITVKIAAIEQRTEFRITDEYNYIGIEIGADAAASLNLDEYMVFDNNSENAKAFFSQLIFKHITPILLNDGHSISISCDEFIRDTFTQMNAFDEFVRAAEGVPRDGINILSLAAQKANTNAISIPDIRGAAKTWYNRNKEQAISFKPKAVELLRWIIDEVIAHRRARAFLLRTDVNNELIDFLYDSRILHVVKQSVSGRDLPGVRYNVYSIDYGCYVDLINTTKAPIGLLEVETEDGIEFVDVPSNDYRAIRGAVLDLNRFEKATKISQLKLF